MTYKKNKKIQKKIVQKNKKIVLLSFLITILLILSLNSYSISTQFTNQQQIYYTGTSTDPSTLYQDAIDGNSDVGIELCDVGQKYVGSAYALNVGGTWQYVLITYSSSSEALAFTSTDVGNGCYQAIPGFLTISPSQLTTPNPNVYKAAFPGRLYVAYESNANPGVLNNFYYGNTNMQLLGDYTIPKSFDQATRTITIETPTVTFQTSAGSFQKLFTDTSFGLSTDKQAVIGICDDDHGETCSDGEVINSNVFPKTLQTGLSASQVNDQNTYTKYAVINGIGKSICIGANLRPINLNVNPNPVYYSQTLDINFAVENHRDTPYETNGGNVDVTTPFNIRITIYNTSNPTQIIYDTTVTNTNTITPGNNILRSISWPAYAHSGFYTVKVEADSNNNINECNEGDNTILANFELKPITLPDIYIDGVQTDTFEYPNIPYNLDIYMKNSDNDTLKNATVIIVEENGLTLNVPLQYYTKQINSTDNITDAVKTKTESTIITDYNGNLNITIIPSYNRLLTLQYNYTNISSIVGNYSLYMTGQQEDGEEFKFMINGTLTNKYPFKIEKLNFTIEPNGKKLNNKNAASQVIDYIYKTFIQFWKTVTG